MDNQIEERRAALVNVLPHFTGSDTLFRHELTPGLYTPGVHYVATTAHAFWLIDEVMTSQLDPFVAAEEFQVWELFVRGDQTATLNCGDGNGKTVFSKFIDYTDFPLESIKFYFENSTLVLPGER